jgi:modulator of FtsH protease HflK
MDRNIQKIGLVNLAALLLLGGALALISRNANSLSGQVGVAFLGLGLFAAIVSYFQMRLLTRERLEKMEFDEMSKGPANAALFTKDAETFPARHSREQFDKYFVPAFTVALCLGQGAAGFSLWQWLKTAPTLQLDQTMLAMALSSMFSLLFFLLGKYSAGIARLENQRLLQPAASYLLLGSVVSLVAALCEATTWFGFPKVDGIVAHVFAAVLLLVSLETLISLILEIYRPRVKGREARVLYDSRLIGLLGQPGGLITTAAQALDYQFGFKVSETWFYQFLEKALSWIILLQLGVLLLSTTVVIIQPQEQGLLERFGKPVGANGVLEPGLYFKWPWPIDQVYAFSTREVHTIYVGYTPTKESSQERTILWTRPHYTNEFDLLVANRDQSSSRKTNDKAVAVNLLSVNIPILYRVKDVRQWMYKHAEAPDLLENIANREVVSYLISVDVDKLMTVGRAQASEEMQAHIQKRIDQYELGVEILLVSLESVHPPLKVAKEYEDVIGARQDKETNILGALAYKAEKVPLALAAATNLLRNSEMEAFMKVSVAAAEAGQFTNQMAAWKASPEVYQQRTYLETLSRAIVNTRKYVLVSSNSQDNIWLNLEDKVRDDLGDLSIKAK